MPKIKNKADPALGALDASPSHLLHRVLQIALDIYSEETGPKAPTQRQFAVLTAVSDNEGLTQSDLVRATGIDRSTLADMVARMIAKGLLERERSATDARANTVRLSAAGRAELLAAAPHVSAADERILALVSPGKRESFLKILRAVAHAGEAMRETDEALLSKSGKKKKSDGAPKKKKKKDKSKKAVKPEAAPAAE